MGVQKGSTKTFLKSLLESKNIIIYRVEYLK